MDRNKNAHRCDVIGMLVYIFAYAFVSVCVCVGNWADVLLWTENIQFQEFA